MNHHLRIRCDYREIIRFLYNYWDSQLFWAELNMYVIMPSITDAKISQSFDFAKT